MRLINADEYKKYLVSCKEIYEKCNDFANADRLKTMIGHLDGMTTIDAEPIKHAYWIESWRGPKQICICSECGDTSPLKRNYCRDCGAKMNKEAEQ